MTVGADRQRQAWGDLPEEMRAAAAQILGSPVVSAETQNGGFSPGSADRVITADGRRAFVKTAIGAHNEHAMRLHEREAEIVAALECGLPVPAVLGHIRGDGWVVAAYEEIVGQHPATPWRNGDVTAVFDAFERISAAPASDTLRALLPTTDESLATWVSVAGWSHVSEEIIAALPDEAWIRAELDGALGNFDAFEAEIRGDRILHLDARADNIFLRAGTAVLVDWPYATIGAGWVDPLSLLVDVAYLDPDADVRELLTHRSLAQLPLETMRRFFFQLAGHFLANSQNPAPPGVPGLREFQHQEGLVCLRIVRALTEK